MDTKYLATKRHFSELFERYSFPVFCINLTKQKYMRERPLADQYMHVTNEILNRELPSAMRIKYINFDYKIRKKEDEHPLPLWNIVKPFIKRTGIFTCNRVRRSDTNSQITVQRGVIRTNCIDSLDRTNEAQSYIALYALSKQLRKLGIILKSSQITKDSPLAIRFLELFKVHGDKIAEQYGGSKAHHTELGKKKNFFKSVVPELMTTVTRHYNNNFIDPKRQLIINLFLGLYKPIEHENQPGHWSTEEDWKTLQKLNHSLRLDEAASKEKWWEDAMRKFEPTMPAELRRELEVVFTSMAPLDSDEEEPYYLATKPKLTEGEDSGREQQMTPASRSMISQSNAFESIVEAKGESEVLPEDDFFSVKEDSRDGSFVDDIASLRQKGRSNAIHNYIANSGHSLHR